MSATELDGARVFVSSTSSGSVDGVAFTRGDIVVFDGATDSWAMFFDGSAAGLGSANVDGFNIVDATPTASVVELSFAGVTTVPGLGRVDDSDVVIFTGTTGAATSGTFAMLLDGSDIGLTSGGEDVDAFAAVGSGYAVSVLGSGSVPQTGGGVLSPRDEDSALFIGTTGPATTGSFAAGFDGSDVGFTGDLVSMWVDPATDRIFGSGLNGFNVTNLSGDGDDVFVFTGSTGSTTSGTFATFFDGDQHRFGGEQIDGLHVELGEPIPTGTADLDVTVTAAVSVANPGDMVSYTVDVLNVGPDPALNVVVTSTVPAGLDFVSTSGCASDPSGLPCSLGMIAPGSTSSFTVTAMVDGSALGPVVVSAEADGDAADPAPGNNNGSDSILVSGPPVAVADGPASSSVPGSLFHTDIDTTYTLAAPGVLSNDMLGSPEGEVASFGGGDLGGSVTDHNAGQPASFGAAGSAQVDADGSIVFTPDTGFTGSFMFEYRLENEGGFSDAEATVYVGPRPVAAGTLVYVSAAGGGSVDGIVFQDEDILVYDTVADEWAMFIDGSDIGLSLNDINGFTIRSVDPTVIDMTMAAPMTLPGLTAQVDDSDVVTFTATATGETTAGTYQLVIDGSDLGLSSGGEDIDALTTNNTDTVFSTVGSFNASGVAGTDEDLVAFTPTATGSITSGSLALLFDGSDVDLNAEDISGASIDPVTGDVYAATLGGFNVAGLSGDNDDIFVFTGTTGATTTGTFSTFFDGDAARYTNHQIDGIHIAPAPQDPPPAEWARSLGGTDIDSGLGVVVDGAGNTYITGSFTGTVDFDPGEGVANLPSNGGSRDVFVLKLDAAGEFVWARSMGGPGFDSGDGIAVDGAGNTYTTGSFREAVDFDPGVGVAELTSNGSRDVFVVKLDAAGEFVWARSMGGAGSEEGLGVGVDGAGNTYTTGYFEGAVDFDPGVGVAELTSNGGRDVFVVKLDAAGEFVWARSMGGPGVDYGRAVVVDGGGNTYATGSFNGTVDFDPGVGVAELTSNGGFDVFVVKLDAAGEFVWARSIGGLGFDAGYGVVVDGAGNTYTTGSFEGTADFDPGVGVAELTSSGFDDVFVVKLDSAGDFVWARNMGGTSSDVGSGVVVDGAGNTYTTGSFGGTVDFDPGVGVAELTSNGSRDVFVVKLDAAGEFVWARSVGGTSSDSAGGVGVDGAGNAYATGSFRETVDFDPGVGVAELTSNGGSDVFVVKLDSSGPTLRVPAATTVAENSTAVGDVDAIDDVDSEGSGLVYSLNAGADQTLFTIDPGTGELAFLAAPDFEAPGDANGDNGYEVELAVTDSDGLSHAMYVTVTVTDVAENTGPSITSAVAVSVAENQTDAIDVQATDDTDSEGAGLVFTLSGGVDEALFGVDAGTGVVRFNAVPDFESPGDANTDNVYDVEVTVTDSGGLTATQSIEVTVTDVDESTWARNMGGTGFDVGSGVVVDAAGNTYTTGVFQGTADFDPGVGVSNLTSNGSGDVFVVKLDSAGEFVWARNMGGTSIDEGSGVAVDGAGNTYTTGYFQGIADFDPGAGVSNLTSNGSDDVFVVKLDSAGDFVWARNMGGTGFDGGSGVAVDGAGNTYTTGDFQGTADFDPGVGVSNLTSNGSSDVFVVKLDSAGEFVWARNMGGTGIDEGSGVAVDGAGNTYTTGYFQGTADFDPGVGVSNLTSNGSLDVFVVKLDSAGDFVWARNMGGTGFVGGSGVVVDAAGNTYTTGVFQGTADFDPGVGVSNLTSNGSLDVFVVKLDSAGDFVWARNMGGTSIDEGSGVAVDGAGNTYTTGYFQGIADFDPGTGVTNLTSNGSLDVFVVKLDSAGDFVWARNMGGTSGATGSGVAVDDAGNTYTTGRFQGTADFDPGVGVTTLTSNGSDDVFVVKLNTSGPTLRVPATTIDENTTAVGDVDAIDDVDSEGSGLVYSLNAGADQTLFTIDPNSGELAFFAAPDFEAPGDANGDNGYEVELAVTDSDGLSHAMYVTVTVTDVDENTGPTITSPAAVSVEENQTDAIDVQATDDTDSEGAGLVFTLSGGVDEALFGVDAGTGVVRFNAVPDFESPGDANTDNVYDVEVTVTDSGGLTATQSIEVTVTDVDESPWARNMGGANSSDRGKGVGVDGAGNTYTTGYFTGTVDFDPGVGVSNLTSNGGLDVFVVKLDSAGDFVWARNMGGAGFDEGLGVAVDGDGNTYTTGYFGGTADFDPGVGVAELTGNGGRDVFVVKLDAAGEFVWAGSMGGPLSDTGYGIAVDDDGNTYTTGSSLGGREDEPADFDPGDGVFDLPNNGGLDVFVVKLDSAGDFVWARNMGGTRVDDGYGIAVDGDGNTYTTGRFRGTADFDPGDGVFDLISNGGLPPFDIDAFVVKLDSAGDFVWARSMGGGTAIDEGLGVAVDGDGNTYTTGSFQGTADFDPGDGVFHLMSNGGRDVFVVKLDASGDFVWARSMGGTFDAPPFFADAGYGVVVDGAGNTYTTGVFQKTVDFDPGVGVAELTSSGFRDVFVVKLDSAGDFVWARNMGGTSSDEGSGVAVDGAGNAYATGNFQGTADFDPGAGVTNLTSNGGTIDVFVVKLDSSGPTLRVPAATTVAENSTAVGDVDAIDDVDSEGSGLVYSINAGADQALFSIDPNSGELAFLAAPDFEAPGDANGDNRYKIELAVTDSDGLSHAVYVTVTVTDVAENTGPIAVDDVYNDLPVNVRLDAGTGAAGIDVDDADGVLTKGTDDSDPEGTPLVVTEVNGGPIVSGVAITLPSGAELSMFDDGTFTYVSEPGETASSDTFTYTVSDGLLTDTATVTINFGVDTIWFVDAAFAGSGNGTSSSPFTTAAAFNAAATDNGDIAHLQPGAYTGEGFVLSASQQLIGAGMGLTSGALTIPVGTRPTLNATTGNGVNLATNNTVRGLNIADTPAGYALSGTGIGTPSIDTVAVSGTGGIMDIDGGNLANVTLGNSSSTGAPANGLSLQNLTGTFNPAGDIDITNSAGTAVQLTDNASASITFPDLSVDNSTSNQPGLVGSGGGTLAITGPATSTIDAGSATAVDLNGMSLGVLLLTVDSVGGSTPGISLTNTTGFFTVAGDNVGCQSNAASCSGGSITDKTGNGVELTNVTNITLNDMNISGNSGNGILSTAASSLVVGDSRFNGNDTGLLFEMSTGTHTLNISGSTFSDNSSAGVQTAASGTATITTNVSNSNFLSSVVGDSSNQNAAIDVTATSTGTANFNILNNPTVTGHRSNAINVFATGSATLQGTIQGNTVGTVGVASSGSFIGNGIRVSNEGSGSSTVLIDGNTVQQVEGDGEANVADSGITVFDGITAGTTSATVTNNDVSFIGDARSVTLSALAGSTMCADVTGNSFSNNLSDPELDGSSGGVVNSTAADEAALEAANNAQNHIISGTVNFGGAACTTP